MGLTAAWLSWMLLPQRVPACDLGNPVVTGRGATLLKALVVEALGIGGCAIRIRIFRQVGSVQTSSRSVVASLPETLPGSAKASRR